MSTIVKTKNSNKFSRAPQDSIILYRPDSSAGEPSSIFYKDRDSSVYKYSGSNYFYSEYIYDSTDLNSAQRAGTPKTMGGAAYYGMPENDKSYIGDIFVYKEEDTGTDTIFYKVFIKISEDTSGTWLEIYSGSGNLVAAGIAAPDHGGTVKPIG